MKKLLFSFIILSFGYAASAQSKEYLLAAEKYFDKADYFSAAQYYEKYLGAGKAKNTAAFNPYAVSATSTKFTGNSNVNKETIFFKLAESYRLLNFHEKAEPNYRQVLETGNTKYPLARYHHATTLRALAKYDEAEAAFNTFINEYSTEDVYRENAIREIANLGFIKSQLVKKDLPLYTVNKAPAGLNSTGGNYAPAWMNATTLLFTSTRPEGKDKAGNYINRVYETDYSTGTPGNVVLSSLPQPADVEQGVVTVTPDGSTMFLSRWVIGKGTKTASLYSSKRSGNKWSAPVSSTLNAEGSNTQQPFIMPDGKSILFSSDRPGGLGGFDLWYAELDNNNNPGAAVNMGSTINTKYDEQAPSFHAASNTLVFSTNGRTGMGGYDFFYSKGSINNFSAPQNFGYPVNSIKDDIYFSSRGTERNVLEDVLLSSDRDAACCLEMFSLNKKKPLKTVEGTVVACETKIPLEGVSISFVDPATNKVIIEKTTDASGRYTFTLEEYQLLKATATLTRYFTNSMEFNSPEDVDAEVLMNMPLCLKLIPEVAITVENVYYDFNKATLKEESFPALDKLVTLLNDNPTMQIELSAHTDSKGTDEYNLKLSDARATSVVDYLISKGIPTSRLIAKGYGEAMPVAENENSDGTDNPEARQKNRRTEFKVLKN
ncbi:MAG: OmpA family protein [Ferruginibacter sp.]